MKKMVSAATLASIEKMERMQRLRMKKKGAPVNNIKKDTKKADKKAVDDLEAMFAKGFPPK